jgi:hypothetical protein
VAEGNLGEEQEDKVSSFRFPRESYIPKGAVKVASKVSSAVVYLYGRPGGKPCAMGFFGKADKPAFNYSYASEKRRAASVAAWIQSMDATQASKNQRKAQRKQVLGSKQEALKVGDVLRSSWGYDQTNIDYYEVVELFGKRGVVIREIGAESADTGWLQGKSVPAKGQYIGEPMRKQVSEDGSVKVRDFGVWAYKLEPVKVAGVPVAYAPSNWTAYA